MNKQTQITNFLRYLTLHGVSQKSLKYYKSDLINFLSWSEGRKVDRWLIQEYINSQKEITPSSTLNRRLSTLRSYSSFIGKAFMAGVENVSDINAELSSRKFKVTQSSPYKFIQELILSKFEAKPKIKNVINKLFFNRPNWYRRYHSYPLATYIHIAILILFTSISGYAVYDQVFYSADRSLAFPASLTRPSRYLSFQGRLTDNLGNPKTVATNMVFKLYDVDTGGSALWNSGTCSITPDQDGIFSTLLGSDCGSEISSNVFSENAAIWLGTTIGADAEATPRIQIATVAYSLNSETLQGFPAGTGTSTIPYINSSGTLVLANSSPKIQSTSGTFAVEGQALTISTPNTSNGIITINPDGVGTLDLTFEGAAPGAGANGFVNATNANITSGALYSGTVASNASGYYFVNYLSGSSPTSKFSVDSAGNTIMAGDLTVAGGNINTGNIALTIGDATTDSITLLTDGTGNGEIILPDNSIGPNEILTTGQTDEYCLTYEGTGATFEWQACAGVSGSTGIWSDLIDPTGNLSLNMAAYTTTMGWTSTGNLDAWTNNFNNNSTSATTQNALVINNATVGSFTDTATENLLLLQQLDTTAAGTTVLTNAFKIDSAGNSGITNGVNITNSAGNITTGINIVDTAGGTITTGIALSGTFTTGIDAGNTIITNIGNASTDFDSSGGLTLAGALTANNTFNANGTVNLGDGGDVITITGSDTNIAIIDGSTVNIDGDTTPTADLLQIGNADISGTTGVDALYINLAISGASGDSIHVLPNYTGGATDALTYNIFESDAFTATNGSGTDTVNGIKLGNLTEAGGITSTAINIGTGWDTILGGTTAGTNILSFTNATLTTAGNLSLAGTTGLTFSSTGGVNLAGGTISDTTDEVDVNDDLAVSGVLQVGGTSATTYSRFGTATAGHGLSSSSDVLINEDLELNGILYLDGGIIASANGTATVILAADPSLVNSPNILDNGSWWVNNNVNNGMAALMVNQAKGGDIFSASSSGTTKFTIQNDGDVVLTNGQLRLGNLSSTPTAEGAGSMFFNTTTNQFQCYNGTAWKNCGSELYSNTNAAVADGSYITVTHNLSTNDLLSSAWINAQGTWKSLDATYRPAIAWEGKDTERGIYHNEVNLYKPSEETNIYTENLLQSGLLFDTFEDGNKTDSANTTASIANQMGDDGSANYATLNQRVQSGRVGLMGGQTYATGQNDNDSHAYLGANTVNDIYYYDRTKDSVPDVLVELGIDPNWYNGVTLSVATGSANYSQNGTIADKNPNLTPNYNGSLIKVTGTDSTPRTIFITIKSPTTFDWTNYQGDSATAVTITPGTAQTLGSTGVSATFSATNYNVGDVFKIASWYIEGSSSTRGTKQQFPERSNLITSGSGTGGSYLDIIDADNQKLWMRFSQGGTFPTSSNLLGSSSATATTSVTALNGEVIIGVGLSSGGLVTAQFNADSGSLISSGGLQKYNSGISLRSGAGVTTVSTVPSTVTSVINDVAAAVIPNQPTQEMTVSGWGYISIALGAAGGASEQVNLPYNFNNIPNVVMSYSGYKATTAPNTLSECTAGVGSATRYEAKTITNRDFTATFRTEAAYTAFACYTWTATGSVSPKQFVAVATGATSSDGGVTIINETDGTKADIIIGSQSGDNLWTDKVALATNNVYVSVNDSTTVLTALEVWYNVHSLTSETSIAQYRHGYYPVQDPALGSWGTNGPNILGTASVASQMKSLAVTPATSTIDGTSNTIYVGTTGGVSVIQEKRGLGNNSGLVEDGNTEAGGSVKYYTKDYISEEMIGDIRGMWSLNNANTASDFEDNSIKGETLTGTNITANGDSVTGVRNTATDFDGSTEYMSCTDANCGGTTELDIGTGGWSVGAWIKTSSANQQTILAKGTTATYSYGLATNVGVVSFTLWTAAGPAYSIASSSKTVNDGAWHHIVGVWNPTGTVTQIYIDGIVSGQSTSVSGTQHTDSTADFTIGRRGDAVQYFTGSIDEVFVTATALTAGQIKNMYQIGSRALQSHGTGLGGGSADANQQLGFISTGTSSIGAVQPDLNNQYMYVGANSTTLGGLSKIQLNSDTNIKTYNSSANVPAGGPLLVDEDINSLGVGYTLDTVGSAASGVKSMGVDNNATATSGNFVSKTYVLPKNIGSAVLWISPVTDSSDGSNTLTVKASNDAGGNYVTCTLVNTNSNPTVPEKEYACTFSTSDNDLKVKFEFVRGSTKTNTYVAQYGISWLGETGFRVEQVDSNNVRLYNFSGESQNLKLNVTGASVASAASPWTDAGSYLYPTGYESLRVYDGAGTNYLGISHDGTLANLTYNGTTVLSINSSGDMLPNTNDAQNLGSDTKRWKDIFLGGETAHIGTSLTDEATISYTTSTNILNIGTDSTSNGDIAFFTDDLYLDKSAGSIGIGTTSPTGILDITDTSNTLASLVLVNNTATTIGNGANTLGILDLQSTSLTTGNYMNIELNGLTSGKGINLTSTSTGLTTGSLLNVTASGNPGATWTGNLGLFEYTSSTDADIDGSALKVGLTGAGAGDGIALNVTTAQTGTSALALRVNDDGTYTDSTPFVIDLSGNVGIGKTAPTYTLDIGTATAGQNTLRIDSASGGSDYSSLTMARGGTNRWNIYVEPSSNNLYFFDANDNQANIRNDASAQNDDGWVTAAIDYGEFMKKQNSQEDIKPFEVVGIKNGLVTKDTNNSTMYMITSSDSGIRGGNPLDDPRDNSNAWIVVAYTGQVPVLVNQEAKNGDYIIPSGHNDGKALAVSPDLITSEQYKTVIGLVLNEFNSDILGNGDGGFEKDVQNVVGRKGSDKVVNVAVGVRSGSLASSIPALGFSESGDITLNGDSVNNYSVSNSEGEINRIGAFASATIAKLRAGFGKFNQIETNVISPVADANLIIDLQADDARSATKLVIKGSDNKEVASIDADGKITSESIETKDATISGTLYADNIESTRLNEIESLLSEVESNQQLLSDSQNWNTNTATVSANISELVADNIFVTGNASVTSLFVSDNLTAKSIDSLDGKLSIQSLALAPIEIMAGRIIIDTNGDTKFLGNVEIAGNLKLDGNFVVASDTEQNATSSGEIIEGQINSNSTAGKALLSANSTEIKIVNSRVKTNSLIYVTPVSSTQNKVLYVKSKDTGEFTVGFNESIDTDVEFNWWIIELGNLPTATESGSLLN